MKHCLYCDHDYDERSPDPCIGPLPGLIGACCGHGERRGYMAFATGLYIEFDTSQIMRLVHTCKGLVSRPVQTPDFWSTSAK